MSTAHHPLPPHHRRPLPPRPSDTVCHILDYDGAATPATAARAAAATERSWDATDNRDTNLDAAAVEEVALGAERTAGAHFCAHL